MNTLPGPVDLKDLIRQIAALGAKHRAAKIVLFGSRARGDHSERSDIDIAVYGLPLERQIYFTDDIDQLPTLLEFDVVYIGKSTSAELLKEIEKDGAVLYEQAHT